MQENEQMIKDKIKMTKEDNIKLESGIKTQVYMLRTMLATFEKIVEYNKKIEQNVDVNE